LTWYVLEWDQVAENQKKYYSKWKSKRQKGKVSPLEWREARKEETLVDNDILIFQTLFGV
jgi:hypothetical protein